MANRITAPLSEKEVFEVSFDEVTPGLLAQKFHEGAAFAIVECRPQIARAWKSLLLNPEENLPWNTRLVDIARNHHPGDLVGQIGDMFYFSVKRLAYTARKFELRNGKSGAADCTPEFFSQIDGENFSINAATRKDCWEFTERIMSSMIPASAVAPSYEVVVHRIKYEKVLSDIENICSLSRNATGKWAQLGSVVDKYREEARGPLAQKGVSDLFALLNLFPPIRGALRNVNERFRASDTINVVAEGSTLIGKAHYDSRFFSAFCGDRETVHTEAWLGGRWVELPIDLHHVVVLPGLLAKKHFKIKPVLHRILHSAVGYDPTVDAQVVRRRGPSELAEESVKNVTLLFGTKDTDAGQCGDRR